VTNECPGDVVSPTGAIADLTYKIINDGLISYTPTWTTSVTGCPITYEIRRVLADLSEITLTAFETAVLTFDSTDGSLDINTSDKALDGEVWTIKLFKRSTYGTQPTMDGIYQFDLTLIDPCWHSTLVAAVMPNAFTWDLWQSESMTGAAM